MVLLTSRELSMTVACGVGMVCHRLEALLWLTSCRFLRVIAFCSKKRSMTFIVRKRVSGINCRMTTQSLRGTSASCQHVHKMSQIEQPMLHIAAILSVMLETIRVNFSRDCQQEWVPPWTSGEPQRASLWGWPSSCHWCQPAVDNNFFREHKFPAKLIVSWGPHSYVTVSWGTGSHVQCYDMMALQGRAATETTQQSCRLYSTVLIKHQSSPRFVMNKSWQQQALSRLN